MDCAIAERLSITLLGKSGASNVRRAIHGRGRDMWCSCFNKISGKFKVKTSSSFHN